MCCVYNCSHIKVIQFVINNEYNAFNSIEIQRVREESSYSVLLTELLKTSLQDGALNSTQILLSKLLICNSFIIIL